MWLYLNSIQLLIISPVSRDHIFMNNQVVFQLRF